MTKRNPSLESTNAACSRGRIGEREVLLRNPDLRVLVVRMTENEDRMRCANIRALLNAPPIEEKKFAVADTSNWLQELFGNDLISVDVLAIEGRDHARVFAKRLH